MTGRVARHVVAHGRVQGVSFRDSIRTEAQRRGVSGWACNRDDGAVEARLEGEEAAVLELVDLCRAGPGSAAVDDIEVTERDVEGLDGFEIR